MSVSTEFTEYILDLLSPIKGLQTTRMFGGVLLKVDGRQLGILIAETLYFKVTDLALQEKYKNQGSVQFTYMRKDKVEPVVIQNWWAVPEYAMDNGEALRELAEEVLCQTNVL